MKRFDNILLIDDDPVSIFLSTQTLLKAGVNKNDIKIANNGMEGLKYLAESDNRPNQKSKDLVLLDLNMPVMNGFDFLDMYTKMNFINKPNIKIIIISSSKNPKEIERGHAFGIDGYIEKPLTLKKVNELTALFNIGA